MSALRWWYNKTMVRLEEKVLEQTRLFMAALPGLLEKHRGKWVVFHEGAAQSVHDSEEEAFTAALDHFELDAGFVIAPVEEVTATPISAGVMFGMVAGA